MQENFEKSPRGRTVLNVISNNTDASYMCDFLLMLQNYFALINSEPYW